jgi:uncharacterized membrane protein (TIGR01666 family)
MDYIKEYKSFVNSYYLSEGVRITTGILLPAIILNSFHQLAAGIIVSTGAMCVSTTDNAGPIHHRKNGMLVCDAMIFIVYLITGLSVNSPFLLGFLIFIFCFFFSMISIYGSRATSIGLSSLLIMVLNIDRKYEVSQLLINSLYVLGGGLWYTGLSLLLYSFRPYKLAQQALGDCIQSTATYLRTRTKFYEERSDFDDIYRQLLEQQVEVHEKQNLVRDLLFKGRDVVKESTRDSRILLMIFLDIVDLFERVMSSHQDYKFLHRVFAKSDILARYRNQLISLADELDQIGLDLKSGKAFSDSTELRSGIRELKSYFQKFRDENRRAENVEAFIALRQILEIIEDIADRLITIKGYTHVDDKNNKLRNEVIDYRQFTSSEDVDPKLFKDNLTLKSNAFRHALRVSIATMAGYIISKFFPFGHSYWTLLTIIVILKPAYSLTKQRNAYRLLGTVAGAALGLLILHFVGDRDIIFILMAIFMVGAYSFMRTRYLVFVILLTPYILFLFHLLYPADFKAILSDRVIDTAIGSAIAFIASLFLVPAWEHEKTKDYMLSILEANRNYFGQVVELLTGKQTISTSYKLARKQAYVSLANLSDAFSRMLSEPKRKQRNIRELHQFVVANHMLTSYIASLSYFGQVPAEAVLEEVFQPVMKTIDQQLLRAETALRAPKPASEAIQSRETLHQLNNRVDDLVEKRKMELARGITESPIRRELGAVKPVADQLNYIYKATNDIEKICTQLSAIPLLS